MIAFILKAALYLPVAVLNTSVRLFLCGETCSEVRGSSGTSRPGTLALLVPPIRAFTKPEFLLSYLISLLWSRSPGAWTCSQYSRNADALPLRRALHKNRKLWHSASVFLSNIYTSNLWGELVQCLQFKMRNCEMISGSVFALKNNFILLYKEISNKALRDWIYIQIQTNLYIIYLNMG